MAAFRIVMDEWALACGFVLSFLVGVVWGWRTCVANRDAARQLAEKLDGKRASTKPIYRIIQRRHGAYKAALYILIVNLLGGSLLRFTLGGILILPPFLCLIALGRLLVLTLARYKERLYVAFRFPVVPFEVAAFIIASVGGTRIGISLFLGGDVGHALKEWMILFCTLVIPLQFIGALFEGLAIHRLHIVQGKPLPEKVLGRKKVSG